MPYKGGTSLPPGYPEGKGPHLLPARGTALWKKYAKSCWKDKLENNIKCKIETYNVGNPSAVCREIFCGADLKLLARPVQFLSRSLRLNQSKPKSPARSKGPRSKYQNMKSHSCTFAICCAWLRNSSGNANKESFQPQL